MQGIKGYRTRSPILPRSQARKSTKGTPKMKNPKPTTKTLKQEIRTAYAPKTAEYLIRNLHKPLDLEMLKRACEMMRGR